MWHRVVSTIMWRILRLDCVVNVTLLVLREVCQQMPYGVCVSDKRFLLTRSPWWHMVFPPGLLRGAGALFVFDLLFGCEL